MERITTYLPNNLTFLRKQKKMTQDQLASLLGVGRSAIGNWETSYRTPDLYDIARMAKIFEVSADDCYKYVMARDNSPEDVFAAD